MKRFARRFVSGLDKFVTHVLVPGMIGLAPIQIPPEDPTPEEWARFDDATRAQFTEYR